MKYIAPIAVIAILLLQMTGSIPQSSVGGPLTIALVIFSAVLAYAIYEAWTNKRGVVGWIVNIVVVILGTLVAAELGDLIVPLILSVTKFQGSLAAAGGILPYIALVGMTLYMLLGSWLALQLVNRWR